MNWMDSKNQWKEHQTGSSIFDKLSYGKHLRIVDDNNLSMSQEFTYSGKLRIQTEGYINRSIISVSPEVMSLFYSGTSRATAGDVRIFRICIFIGTLINWKFGNWPV